MNIRASVPDETTYLAIFMGLANFVNSVKIYANKFNNFNNTEFYFVIASSILLGALIGTFLMRKVGWVLPEK